MNKICITFFVYIFSVSVFYSQVSVETLNKRFSEIKENLNNQYFDTDKSNNFIEPNKSSLCGSLKQLFELEIPKINFIQNPIKNNQNDLLNSDTLWIGIPPLDSLIVDSNFTHKGPIILVLNGKLIFRNCEARIFGDVFLMHNSKFEIHNSKIQFPQEYFYQRSIMLTGSSEMIIRNSILDFSNLSHNLVVADSGKVDINGITNYGFTTTGMYSFGKIQIENSNECGEFVMSQNVSLDIKNSKTALLWHHIGKNANIDIVFPDGDSLNSYILNSETQGVKGINYTVNISNCKNVMWGLMPENGSVTKVNDSKIRAIGLWLRDSIYYDVNGLVNNSFQKSFLMKTDQFNLQLNNSFIETWNIYTFDKANLKLSGSIVGEIGAMGNSKVECSKVFCDGSGGYLWSTDTSFTIYGFSSANTSIRSQKNGIFVFAYSTLGMGQALAVDNSILMLVQSTIPEDVQLFNNSAY